MLDAGQAWGLKAATKRKTRKNDFPGWYFTVTLDGESYWFEAACGKEITEDRYVTM